MLEYASLLHVSYYGVIRQGCLLTNLSSFHAGWDKVMRGISDALDIGLGTVKVSHCRYCSYSTVF